MLCVNKRTARRLAAAVLCAGLSLSAVAVGMTSGALAAVGSRSAPVAVPPPLIRTGPVSLQGWTLTLPVPDLTGFAAVVAPADFTTPWLTPDAQGNLLFWAPSSGVTTLHSTHARTELNSSTSFLVGAAVHTLGESVAVNQVPTSGKDVILGQIHGAGPLSAVSMVLLHYTAGVVRVVVKQQQLTTASLSYPLLSGVPKGARFDFGLTDDGNGSLTFTARYRKHARAVVVPIPAAFSGATVRFQAGAYQQSTAARSTSATDGARVTVYVLSTS